jgi:hypothetical protein
MTNELTNAKAIELLIRVLPLVKDAVTLGWDDAKELAEEIEAEQYTRLEFDLDGREVLRTYRIGQPYSPIAVVAA